MKPDLQQARMDIEKAASDDARLHVLLEKSHEFYRTAPQDAVQWANDALKLAVNIKDRFAEARAHYYIGRVRFQLSDYASASKEFQNAIRLDTENTLQEGPIFSLGLTLAEQGNYADALEYYTKALATSRAHHSKSEIDILSAMGNAALQQGDYPRALEYQYQSLSLVEREGDSLRRAVVLANIGWVYLEVNDLDRATIFFERSQILWKELDDNTGLSSTLVNLGIIAQKRGESKAARSWFENALKLVASVSTKNSAAYNETAAYVEQALGSIELEAKRPAIALQHFERSIELAESINVRAVLCAAYIGKGRALVSLQRAAESISELEQTIRSCQESGLAALECEGVATLAKAYEAVGSLRESVSSFNKFIELSAKLHDQARQRAIVEITARVEIEKADRERARMERLAQDANERVELLRAESARQSKELTALALDLVERNEFLCNLKEEIEPAIRSKSKAKSLLDKIDNHVRSDRDWETFEHQFDQVHRDFLHRLSTTYPTLTPTELKIAVLVKLNLPTKAVANLLCLSVRTVENHRQSIRRKLKLRGDANLLSFLTAFGGEQ